jgi:hypothetical protein
MRSFGRLRLSAIASRMAHAVAPSTNVAMSSCTSPPDPAFITASSSAAMWKRYDPGMSETTDAKAKAAKGKCRRFAIGVTEFPQSGRR